MILLILDLHDHIHPALMSSALKLGIQPRLSDHLGKFTSHHPGAKSQDIGVVVHSGKFGRVRLTAYACADTLYLVGSQGE